jgi:hypothetical protein
MKAKIGGGEGEKFNPAEAFSEVEGIASLTLKKLHNCLSYPVQ